MYSIKINALELEAHIGCTAAELETLQSIKIDLEIDLNLDPRQIRDSLEETLDYGKVIITLQELLSTKSWKTLEGMCADLSRAVFALSDKVLRTDLVVHKFVFAETDSVAVRLRLSREEL